jgi:hypothetical protein
VLANEKILAHIIFYGPAHKFSFHPVTAPFHILCSKSVRYSRIGGPTQEIALPLYILGVPHRKFHFYILGSHTEIARYYVLGSHTENVRFYPHRKVRKFVPNIDAARPGHTFCTTRRWLAGEICTLIDSLNLLIWIMLLPQLISRLWITSEY